MRESDRPEGRIADRCGVDVADGVLTDVDSEFGGELHEESVRMLPVDESFTGLKTFGVTALSDGCRLEAEHRSQEQLSAADGALGRAHHPIRCKKFVAASLVLNHLIDR